MSPNNPDFSCCPLEGKGIDSQVPGHIARCAQLAMLLEVSASPKPGNVDREHNYPDTCFEHFIASSVGVYPVFEMAAKNRTRIGTLVKNAVFESTSWQRGGNTHFGAFLLLIPLSMAAGTLFDSSKKPDYGISREEFKILTSRAHALVRGTDCEDAVEFYRAFSFAGVRVNDVEEFSLKNSENTAELRQKGITLYELMEIAKSYDLIADEWTSGFGRCLEASKIITGFMETVNSESKNPARNCSGTGISEAVVYTFLKLLSKNRDTFIQTKFDKATADHVSKRAEEVLAIWKEPTGSGKEKSFNFSIDFALRDFALLLPAIREFDAELLEKKINPGSTADIIIAGLFLSLLGGLRF